MKVYAVTYDLITLVEKKSWFLSKKVEQIKRYRDEFKPLNDMSITKIEEYLAVEETLKNIAIEKGENCIGVRILSISLLREEKSN